MLVLVDGIVVQPGWQSIRLCLASLKQVYDKYVLHRPRNAVPCCDCARTLARRSSAELFGCMQAVQSDDAQIIRTAVSKAREAILSSKQAEVRTSLPPGAYVLDPLKKCYVFL